MDIKNTTLVTLVNDVGLWMQKHVFTPDTAIQLALIALAFSLASIITRYAQNHLNDRVNALRIPYRLTEIVHSLIRLLLPATALLLIFAGGEIIALKPLGFSHGLCEVVSKLLFAWILIRLSVQFISNRFSRNIVAFVIWGIAALSIFGILEPTMALLDSFGMDLGDFRFSVLTVIKIMMALFILLYGALFLASFIERRISLAASLTPSSRVLISKIIRVILIVSAILIGITTAGVDLSLLAVFSGAVGLGLGFGLKNGMSNLFSGMMLLMDQSIKPGDIIEMFSQDGKSSTFGWVQYMGSRYTEIVTRDNKSYLIPNEQLVTQQVVNWSHGDTLVRLEVFFHVSYDTDPHMIKKITAEAAAKPSRVVSSPAPQAHIVEYDGAGFKFALRFWIRDAEKGVTNIKGDVLLAIWDAFKEHQISVPPPRLYVTVEK
ncbi:MAG: mechanosensitive ion channel [Alphaproteobacteria bacterium]|nr:mechanosensitive ion channel [Alphaproteobacteria bacterium]